jgi:hypothetical protein
MVTLQFVPKDRAFSVAGCTAAVSASLQAIAVRARRIIIKAV